MKKKIINWFKWHILVIEEETKAIEELEKGGWEITIVRNESECEVGTSGKIDVNVESKITQLINPNPSLSLSSMIRSPYHIWAYGPFFWPKSKLIEAWVEENLLLVRKTNIKPKKKKEYKK